MHATHYTHAFGKKRLNNTQLPKLRMTVTLKIGAVTITPKARILEKCAYEFSW